MHHLRQSRNPISPNIQDSCKEWLNICNANNKKNPFVALCTAAVCGLQHNPEFIIFSYFHGITYIGNPSVIKYTKSQIYDVSVISRAGLQPMWPHTNSRSKVKQIVRGLPSVFSERNWRAEVQMTTQSC